jgi:peptidoglycan/LPS O-acetylase OafA/YrhL
VTQYPALTSLRFIAALLVFLFHFPPDGAFWDVVAGEGHVGVTLFFVLSGFLITRRYVEGVAGGEVRLREYFLRRAARILPLYYAVLALSLLLTNADTPSPAALLPELTLTHALLGDSIESFTVPTSWSLTVEECFYATAPLLFLGLAAARRRWPQRPVLAGAGVLALVTLGALAAGAGVWTALAGRGPAFLHEPYHVVIHTLFGRFYDFACGALAALVLTTPRATDGRGVLEPPAAAAVATTAAGMLIVFVQWRMHEAGGIEAAHWVPMWSWDALLAPAGALLVLSLTSVRNPFSRLLAPSALQYLGKVSYALYLVQSTPLGKGWLYRLLPHHGYVALIVLYAGMTLISAALYELIEEPARRLILRMAGLAERSETSAPPQRESLWTRFGAPGVLAFSVALQCATWAVSALAASRGPVTLEELSAAGLHASDRVLVDTDAARWSRDVLLVALPAHWREGWGEDLRAPGGLHVFMEGKPIPFSRREPAGDEAAAFFRGPRAESLALRVSEVPDTVVVARGRPLVATRVEWARVTTAPRQVLAVSVLFVAVFAAGLFGLRGLAPRPAVVLALALLIA